MRFFPRRKQSDSGIDEIPRALPQINQRITVKRANGEPLASRVDDETSEHILIAAPTAPLHEGETIQVTWEDEDGWFRLESTVEHIQVDDKIPTVALAKRGAVRRFDERRGDLRRRLSRPLELQVVRARVLKTGRTLRTHTVELSPKAVRFSTNAPLAPGDLLEATLTLSSSETVSGRVKVIRMDSISSSWRQLCTASFDQILMSDSSKISRLLEEQTGGSVQSPS